MGIDDNLAECLEACSQRCLESYPKTGMHKALELGAVGLMVIVLVPFPVICAEVTAMVSMVELSDVFLIVMFLLSTRFTI